MTENNDLNNEQLEAAITRSYRMGQVGRQLSPSPNYPSDQQSNGSSVAGFSFMELPPDIVQSAAKRATAFTLGQMISPSKDSEDRLSAPVYNIKKTGEYLAQGWETDEFGVRMGKVTLNTALIGGLLVGGDDFVTPAGLGTLASGTVSQYEKAIKTFDEKQTQESMQSQFGTKFPTDSGKFGFGNSEDESVQSQLDRSYVESGNRLTFGIVAGPVQAAQVRLNTNNLKSPLTSDESFQQELDPELANANSNALEQQQPLMDYNRLPSGRLLSQLIDPDERDILGSLLMGSDDSEQNALDTPLNINTEECESPIFEGEDTSNQETTISMAPEPEIDEILELMKNPFICNVNYDDDEGSNSDNDNLDLDSDCDMDIY